MRNEVSRINRTAPFLAAVLGLLGLVFLPALAIPQKIKTEDGIPVVHNPREPAPARGGPTRLVLTRELVIGEEKGDENYMFSSLMSIQVDDEGNIYALDRKENKIKVFDNSGKHFLTFGKKGQGPGEMQAPSRSYLTPQKQLAILDMGNKRIAYYSLQGECRKEISTAKWTFLQIRVDGRSQIYAENFAFSEKGVLERLLKFDQELNLTATVAEVFNEAKPPKVNPLPDRYVYDIIRGDHLIWALTSKYEIHVLGPGGTIVRKIVKDYDPVKITNQDKERVIKERFGDEGVPPGVTLEFPANYAPIYSMIADDKDRIFVRTNTRDTGGGYCYDVFDSDGTCFLSFALPEEEALYVVKKDKMYCLIQENAAGIPQIKRYAMEWK